MNCQKCGAELRPKQAFCTECGEPVQPAQPEAVATPIAPEQTEPVAPKMTETQYVDQDATEALFTEPVPQTSNNDGSMPPPQGTDIQQTPPKKKKNGLLIGIICGIVALILVACVLIGIFVIKPLVNYNKAVELMEAGEYEAAIDRYAEKPDYKDSATLILECKYLIAGELFDDKSYVESEAAYLELGSYKDSATLANESKYLRAVGMIEEDAETARELFVELGEYSDSADKINTCDYRLADAMLASGDNEGAIEAFTALGDYTENGLPSAADRVKEAHYRIAADLLIALDYDAAAAEFELIAGYSDADTQRSECFYQKAEAQFAEDKYDDAITTFELITGYKDAYDRIKECRYQKAIALYNKGKFTDAIEVFQQLSDYEDSKTYVKDSYYGLALEAYNNYNYDDAEDYIKLSGTNDAKKLQQRMDGEYYAAYLMLLLANNGYKNLTLLEARTYRTTTNEDYVMLSCTYKGETVYVIADDDGIYIISASLINSVSSSSSAYNYAEIFRNYWDKADTMKLDVDRISKIYS